MTPNDEDVSRLSRLVRLYRNKAGLRQDDLARLAGVSRNTITALEAGHTTRPKRLAAILAALGLDPEELIVNTPPTAPPGAPRSLAGLTDAQLANEAIRLLAEMAARLQARPVATAVPEPDKPGVLTATARVLQEHPSSAR